MSNSGNNVIYEFAASANGSLTPVSGSPYVAQGIGSLAANSSAVFGVQTASSNIISYSIGSNGALSQVSSINDPNGPDTAFMDASGQDFYTLAQNIANYTYDAFAAQSNGSLTALGLAGGNPPLSTDPQLSFTGNDNWAYAADCYRGSAEIMGFSRSATGALTYFDPQATLPTAPSGYSYCPAGTAVSGNGSVVMPLELMTNDGMDDSGTGQVAVYAIGSNGTLSTTSTSSTMTTPAVGAILYLLKFDPTGTYLAVPGQNGVQIYTFNAGVLTPDGAVMPSGGASELAWDKSGNLYALNPETGDVYVYHLTNGVPAPVSGSPFTTAAGGETSISGLAVAVP